MCPCPAHLAMALAFLASFAGWAWLWLQGKRFERRPKKHNECHCKEPPDRA